MCAVPCLSVSGQVRHQPSLDNIASEYGMRELIKLLEQRKEKQSDQSAYEFLASAVRSMYFDHKQLEELLDSTYMGNNAEGKRVKKKVFSSTTVRSQVAGRIIPPSLFIVTIYL